MASWEPDSFADQLNIDTPEQVELHFALAGIGSRFVAVLVDLLIQAGFYVVAVFFFAFLLGGAVGKLDVISKWFLAAFIALNFCLIWGYFTLFEAFWRGQTPGKHVMKLRVVKDSGRQITLFEAMTRNLLRIVDYLPSLYFIGVITMLCNKRNQRLGDLAAGTIVIHERADEAPLFTSRATNFFSLSEQHPYESLPQSAPSAAVPLPADAVARLGPDDLSVIEAFFARALDLSLETRAQIAQRIADRMAAKMDIGPPEGNPERLLETIAYAMRSSGRLRPG